MKGVIGSPNDTASRDAGSVHSRIVNESATSRYVNARLLAPHENTHNQPRKDSCATRGRGDSANAHAPRGHAYKLGKRDVAPKSLKADWTIFDACYDHDVSKFSTVSIADPLSVKIASFLKRQGRVH